jgi:hypothetical protein
VSLYRIRPLIWKPDTWANFTTVTADVPFGWITIRRDDFDAWSVWFKSDLPVSPVWRTLEAAKSAAESYCRSMLLEALEPATDYVGDCIREIRGDVDDRTLIDRLCEVQGYLRHGVLEPATEQDTRGTE